MSMFRSVAFLSGGVGGARLLHGMAEVLPPEALTAIVNTGDDFRHWGLWVSPDVDTVLYTLSGRADEARGWGLCDESFRALEQMRAYGAEGWFSLGDTDLATHLFRSEALARGDSLSAVTERMAKALGVKQRVLPMCDGPRPTLVETSEHGTLSFQEWLVQHRAPRALAVRFTGEARPSAQVLEALDVADLVVIGPSNPYVSIDPILALDGVRERVADKLVVALSPIVAGRAIKGPLADMLRTLAGESPSPGAIVRHYRDLVSGIVVERGDEVSVGEVPALGTSTVMGGASDRARLAGELLAFAASLA